MLKILEGTLCYDFLFDCTHDCYIGVSSPGMESLSKEYGFFSSHEGDIIELFLNSSWCTAQICVGFRGVYFVRPFSRVLLLTGSIHRCTPILDRVSCRVYIEEVI